MTDKDKTIKKQWMLIWIVNTLFGFFFTILQHIKSPVLAPLAKMNIPISIAITLAFGWAIYTCAYKKNGTKLITYCFYFTVFSLIIMSFLYLNKKVEMSTYIPFYTAYFCVSQALGVIWAIGCWRVRAVNKKLQAMQ